MILEPRPIVPLPGTWTFWADMVADIGGREPGVGGPPWPGAMLGNVDVSAFACTSRLSAFGHGQATVVLPCGLDPERLRRLWSWRLWAFYDGLPYWCGVPTGITDENGAAWANITLTELPGYLTKRQWERPGYSNYPNMEQTDLAYELAGPVEDVGVWIERDPGPGFRRDRKYEYLESTSRGQLLINLCNVLDGPEFRSEYRMSAGRPVCYLKIAYPRVGSGGSGLGVTVPGGAVGYRATWDSDQLRTRTFAVGDLPENADADTVRPVAVVDRPQPDLPRLDSVDDWPGTILQSTLTERANTMATTHAGPSLALTASPPESFPPITGYGVGDDVTIRAVTPLLPNGIEVTGRLIEIDINAQEGTATWTVATPSPPPVPRESLTRRLDRLDTTLSGVFHRGRLQEAAARGGNPE
jgi:hypothetical protein